MPIDPSIPLLATKGINTPFENLDKALQAQQTQSLNAQRDALSSKLRAEQDEQARVRSFFEQTGGDLSDETLDKLVSVAPTIGTKLRGDILEQRAKALDATGKEIDNQKKLYQEGLSLLLGAAANPALYPQARMLAIKKGGDLAELLKTKPTYEPETVQALIRTGRLAEKQLEADEKLRDDLMKGEYRYLAGALALIQDDPEEVQKRIEAMRGAGVPKRILDALMADPSGMSMTAAERDQSADRAEGRTIQREGQAIQMARDAAAAEERVIDNKRADAQLAISRGQLALSQQNAQNQPLETVIGPDGKPVLVRRADAVGKSPASTAGTAASGTKGPNVGAILNEIETLSKQINTGGSGPLSNIRGLVRRGAASANMDNTVSEYNALVEGFIPMVARAVGHVGVLTQQDVDSVRALFPRVEDNATLAKNKIDRVKSLMSSVPGAVAGEAPASAPNRTPVGGSPVIEVVAPNGKTYTFPNQAQADQFKRRAGIQ